MKSTMISRQHSPQIETAITPTALSVSTRPQLVAQWVTGKDGRLVCRWNREQVTFLEAQVPSP